MNLEAENYEFCNNPNRSTINVKMIIRVHRATTLPFPKELFQMKFISNLLKFYSVIYLIENYADTMKY